MIIDTHTHIYEPEFDDDRDQVIERAIQAGVKSLLLPNINEESIPRMLRTSEQYPSLCHPMMGLHPEDVKQDWQDILDRMQQKLNDAPKGTYIAIGEVGLDYYWDDTYRHEQQQALERQITWAHEHQLPLVIHTRKAEDDLLRIMKSHKHQQLRGIFHCFSGSNETAQALLQHQGFCLGIGGVVTFKNCHLAQTLQNIPLERIVVETDAPYLAPTPHRSKRNEPSYLTHIVQKLADIYNTTTQHIEKVTTDNAERIFGPL